MPVCKLYIVEPLVLYEWGKLLLWVD